MQPPVARSAPGAKPARWSRASCQVPPAQRPARATLEPIAARELARASIAPANATAARARLRRPREHERRRAWPRARRAARSPRARELERCAVDRRGCRARRRRERSRASGMAIDSNANALPERGAQTRCRSIGRRCSTAPSTSIERRSTRPAQQRRRATAGCAARARAARGPTAARRAATSNARTDSAEQRHLAAPYPRFGMRAPARAPRRPRPLPAPDSARSCKATAADRHRGTAPRSDQPDTPTGGAFPWVRTPT